MYATKEASTCLFRGANLICFPNNPLGCSLSGWKLGVSNRP